MTLPSPVSSGASFAGECFRGTAPFDAHLFEERAASLLHHTANQGYDGFSNCTVHRKPVHVHTIPRAAGRAD